MGSPRAECRSGGNLGRGRFSCGEGSWNPHGLVDISCGCTGPHRYRVSRANRDERRTSWLHCGTCASHRANGLASTLLRWHGRRSNGRQLLHDAVDVRRCWRCDRAWPVACAAANRLGHRSGIWLVAGRRLHCFNAMHGTLSWRSARPDGWASLGNRACVAAKASNRLSAALCAPNIRAPNTVRHHAPSWLYDRE